MPAITHYDPQQPELRISADLELRQRRTRIALTRAYYEGEHPHQLDDPRDHVVLNLSRQVVDETIAFLLPKMPTIELDDDQTSTSERENWLRACWEHNGGAGLVHQLALNGALCGHVYAKIIPQAPYPRIVPMNPANVITWWRADDWQTVVGYEIRWEAPEGVYRQDIFRADDGTWHITDYTATHPKANRRSQGRAEWHPTETVVWAYPYPPMLSWGHMPASNQHYGRDELAGLIPLNMHINKVASDIKSILRYHAYPTTVGTGFSAKDVQETRIDGFLTIPDKDARVFNVEMQSDLASSLALLDRLEAHFLGISRVVLVRGGVDAFRGMTNLGVRTAFLPMMMKNEQLRRAYGQGIRDISRTLLAFCPAPSNIPHEPIYVHWGDPLPIDRAELVRQTEAELSLGVIDAQTAIHRLQIS